MGLYTDLASGTVATGAKPAPGLDKSSREQLLAQAHRYDPVVEGVYAAADAVVVLAEETDAGAADTYTLTITLPRNGESFTTAAIAYNAVATAIESAIDTAASGVVTGWTNGDISVAMGGAAGLDDGTVTITFDGDSVTESPATVAITATGFTSVNGSPTYSTYGRTDRKAAHALVALGVVDGIWESIDTPGVAKGYPLSRTRPRRGLIIDLARVAAWEDGSDAILAEVEALYPVSAQ